ncbi:alpha-amylase family protein [Glaciecola sp. MH2013]|uniref:alpha-amylase family protein n=1 Tax=Glaciecola sp. MH2013 TaxID=2785524 RepID=UPI0018A062C0|nr:alpha-amylase family protein [Glaciecola sp. MH2013]MBF7072303.1 alpha-amylase family protein [Glaciecola sp. MH2013]
MKSRTNASFFKAISIIIVTFIWSIASIQHARADVILHAFNWNYNEVKNKANEIADIGYKAVLVAPPLKSGSNCAWWARYQPQDYRVIDHCQGNKESFQAMIDALNSKGVVVYADIVLNHMANERNNSTYFPGDSALNDYQNNANYWNKQKLFGDLSNGFLSPWDFHSEACISDYNSIWQVQNWRICGGNGDRGLPDLDPNGYVRSQQRQYLQALKDMGVKGFRVDAAKHMTNWHMNQVFTSSIKRGMHIFGEVITGGGTNSSDYRNYLGPYLSGTDHDAYDFPLLNTMRNALRPGGSMTLLENPIAFGNALPGSRAVTMPITHDIPTNGGFRYLILDPSDEHLAYAYVLGRRDGAPMVFSDSTGVDNNRWVNDYRQSDIKAMVRFHNKVRGQGQETIYSDDCVLAFRRGKEGVVGINKCGGDRWVELRTNEKYYWYRNYRDTFSGETFQINSSSKWVRIPGRSARMWYAD